MLSSEEQTAQPASQPWSQGRGMWVKAGTFCLTFPNGWYKILTCVYGVPLNPVFALRTGAKISRCGALGAANLRGHSRALEPYKGAVNQQGCVHTLPGSETRETLVFSPLLLYQLDFPWSFQFLRSSHYCSMYV